MEAKQTTVLHFYGAFLYAFHAHTRELSRNLRYEAAFDAYTQLGKGLATSGLMVGQEVCRVTHCS